MVTWDSSHLDLDSVLDLFTPSWTKQKTRNIISQTIKELRLVNSKAYNRYKTLHLSSVQVVNQIMLLFITELLLLLLNQPSPVLHAPPPTHPTHLPLGLELICLITRA